MSRLSEQQRARIVGAIKQMRHEFAWQTIRQFCIAEYASDQPEIGELKSFIMGEIERVLDDEFRGAAARYPVEAHETEQ